MLSLLAVLVAKANAAPADRYDEDGGGEIDDEYDRDGDAGGRSGRRARVLDEPWSEVGPCECDEAMFARQVASAPSVRDVVAAAERTAGVDEDASTSWRRRSKLAALVPMLSVRVGNTQSWRDVVDPTVNRAAAFDVRASWRLDRLVFDSIEMRIDAQEIARRRERRAVAALAGRAYFAWLRAEASAAGGGAAGRGRWALRAAEAAAELDALTDGWFSETVANHRESR
ncbi:MAG: hypothetical protein HOV81_43140 [Kofleriaceae bacterium]|nr:hypothetical protein [Kofleriaceae bacterium]